MSNPQAALAAALAADISAGDAQMYAWLTEGGSQPLPAMTNGHGSRSRADSMPGLTHAQAPLPVTTGDTSGLPLSPFADILLQHSDALSGALSPAPADAAMLLAPGSAGVRSPGEPAQLGDRSLSATFAGFRAGANAALSKLVATFGMQAGVPAPAPAAIQGMGMVSGSGGAAPRTETHRSLSFSSLDDTPAATPAPLVAPTAHVVAASTAGRGRKRLVPQPVATAPLPAPAPMRRNASGSSTHLASLLEATGNPFAVPQERAAPPRKRARGGGTAGSARPASSSSGATAANGASAAEIGRLREENAELREHIRMLTSGEAVPPGTMMPQQEATRQQQLRQLMQLAQARAPEAQLRKAIFEYKDLHADFGHDRWAALRYHLRSLKQLLVPNQITRMCMWSLTDGPASGSAPPPARGVPTSSSQGSTTNTESADAIWNSLVQHCEMTPEQLGRMTTLRAGISERRKELLEVLNTLRSLEDKVGGSFRGLEFQMNLLMSHLSPRQIALFLEWMEMNQAVVSSMATVNAWPQPPMPPPTPPLAAAAPARAGKRSREAAAVDRPVVIGPAVSSSSAAPPPAALSEDDDGDFDSYPFPVRGNGTLFNMSFPVPSEIFAAMAAKLRPSAAPAVATAALPALPGT